LIQGPTIVDLYTKWFAASQRAEKLQLAGRDTEAKETMLAFSAEVNRHLGQLSSRTFSMKLGNNLEMNIRSQQPSLEDPLMSKDNFELIPQGYSFKLYMEGYFHDMVAHELGHTLGLRHNFKGSLGAVDGPGVPGGVSRSIMEYLGRSYRQLDRLGEYDTMAFGYGYLGLLPTHTDWYCTDEDSADIGDPTKSAECTSDDASGDPFSYYESRLMRATDYLVARGKTSTPDWSIDELRGQVNSAVVGMAAYAVSAENTASTWTNFFNRPGRPNQASEVKAYVLARLKGVLCDPSLALEIDGKDLPEGKAKAQSNLMDLKRVVFNTLYPVYQPVELGCGMRQFLK
jgi:hypothetical protein